MISGVVHQTWSSQLPRPEDLDVSAWFRTRTNAAGDIAVLHMCDSEGASARVTDLAFEPRCVAFALSDLEELYSVFLGAWR